MSYTKLKGGAKIMYTSCLYKEEIANIFNIRRNGPRDGPL